MFVIQGEKRLMCHEAVSVVKECNLRQHLDIKHRDKYAKFSIQEKEHIVQECKGRLQLQQEMFIKATDKNVAILEVNFIVAEEFAECWSVFQRVNF